MADAGGRREGTRWLVLMHQLPQEPGSLRVKIWRRLQSVGAVAIKNAMYVLPMSEQMQEDFEWILREVTSGGGTGAILESKFIGGLNDSQVERLFDEARDEDYRALSDEIRSFQAGLGEVEKVEQPLRDARNQLTRFRKKLTEIESIDFFGANGRETAEGLLAAFTDHVTAATRALSRGGESVQDVQKDELIGKVWVTRRNVHVDRIASAWFVRRWIDPDAVFKFTGDKNYSPSEKEVRFDMFEGEFTHEGDKCTFEVLLSRTDHPDSALQRIAEIVHDIDLKDGKYNHEETPGIANLFTGIVAGIDDDDRRIERGAAMLDDLCRSFQETKK